MVNVQINGLTELRDALRKLPAALVGDATVVVRSAADDTARQIQSVYGAVRRTGTLVNQVRVEHTGDGVHATSRVISAARHAYLYERGTGARRRANGASTGTMPAANQFIPIAMARRQIMVAALIEVVERAGLTVSRASV